MLPALLLSLAACVSGMQEYEGSAQQWQEEVQLQDGRVIFVTRTEYYSAFCGGGGARCVTSRGPAARGKIEFEHADERAVWAERMRPIILQVDRGAPVVVATFVSCRQYLVYGDSNRSVPPYLAFRYEGGQWHKVPVETLTFPPQANLLVSDAGFGSWTSLERKKEFNSRRGLSKAYLGVYPKRPLCQ